MKTAQLCFFAKAPGTGTEKYIEVPSFVAEEVENYRAVFAFLFPHPHGRRFELCAPDLLEPSWTVWDRKTKSTLAVAPAPVEAVLRAIAAHESRNESRNESPFALGQP